MGRFCILNPPNYSNIHALALCTLCTISEGLAYIITLYTITSLTVMDHVMGFDFLVS